MMRLDHRLTAAALMAAIFIAGGVAGGFAARAFVPDRGPEWRDGEWTRDRTSDRDWSRDREWSRQGDWGSRGGPPGDWGNRGGPPGDPRAFTSSRAVEQLTRRLDLSEEQHDSLEVILETGRERASMVFADIGPRLRTVLDSTNVEIRALLDPTQQEEFDRILEEDRDVLGRRFVPGDSIPSR
jgi:hypothetical protein